MRVLIQIVALQLDADSDDRTLDMAKADNR